MYSCTSACSLKNDGCSQESEDDHNEGVETMATSEVTCDKKCQKKHARGVSEQARDISIFTHGTVVESMTDFARD